MSSIKKFSVLALALAASSAFAGNVVQYDTFGSLSAANFGGSGIPNNAVAITTLGNGVTLGMTATQRYASANVTSNGAGVFHANAGDYVPPSADNNIALWNFDFYVGGANMADYTYKLFGDYSSAVGDLDSSYTDISGYLSVADSLLTAGTIQNSENPGFNTDLAQFDPTVAGQYGFYLAAFDRAGTEVGRSAILVNVPEPGTLALAGLALVGMAGLRRRKA
jgi:hypothetical protein